MSRDEPLAWDHPDPHILRVSVSDEHIDVMRHTNNVVYLQWLEAVAWSHSQHLGLGPAEYEALGHGMVVRRHELNYIQATRLGEHLSLATWLTQVDRLSTHRCYQFIREDDGQTVFRGSTHFVCVDIAEGRIRRMPPAFFEAYSAAALPPGALKD
ncbi:acyl-CoA thioesterase [Amnimonas aquatica]|uniref:Acyl-CoA thioesterase n=1 Tax=Amnimonas aquatica TaxID=2094561 RepID=A0A2P6AU30_9GAMM|nr:thioesterase family protein [Amnimonas aquatica]PQA48946.1 acyl-CoA thioesterase [Amnimonas aquatica]